MPTGNHPGVEARLQRLVTYIHDNLDGDLSLDTLAEVACMSRFHWHRVFRAVTGETLADAVRRIRLLRAANALVLEDRPLAEIAKRCGYPNLASFSRAFSAAHGMSPGAFRRRGAQLAIDLRRTPGDCAMHPVTIEDFPSCRAAGILHTGPYPELGRAFQQLGALIAARNLFTHTQAMIAIYYDGPGSKPDAEMRAHAAVITAEGFPADIEGLEYFDIAGGHYAVMAHQGAPASLPAA